MENCRRHCRLLSIFLKKLLSTINGAAYRHLFPPLLDSALWMPQLVWIIHIGFVVECLLFAFVVAWPGELRYSASRIIVPYMLSKLTHVLIDAQEYQSIRISVVIPILASSSALQLPSMSLWPAAQIRWMRQCVAISFRDLQHAAMVLEFVKLESNALRAAWLSENRKIFCSRGVFDCNNFMASTIATAMVEKSKWRFYL